MVSFIIYIVNKQTALYLLLLLILLATIFSKELKTVMNKKENFVRNTHPLQVLWSEGFKLGNVIGKGSYSKVRIAKKNGNLVAIKMISIREISETYRDYFVPRELEILSQLSHPNIIPIHRIMYTEEHIYIFMEYAEKGNLQEYIDRHRFLRNEKAKKYFRFIVNAVEYLHSKDISHRDLKCENLLITENDVIKLTDFGFSRKNIDMNTKKKVLSETYCGSPGYSAPEILLGLPYNPLISDIWSIGVILYNMITGKLPFNESRQNKIIKCQLEHRYSSPSDVNDNISIDCKLLISHLLEPDAIKRFTIKQVIKHPWICEQDKISENKNNGIASAV